MTVEGPRQDPGNTQPLTTVAGAPVWDGENSVTAGPRGAGTLRPMPIFLFILIGLLPIALDGFSQLFSQFAVATGGLNFLDPIFPLRESNPFLRALTGALFGFSLVWLTFPRIEPQMQAVAAEHARKLATRE